jgi:Transposase/Transposase IS116/IS110/IS902 family
LKNVSTLNTAEEKKPSYAAHIGLDWADQKHFWTMRTAEGKSSRGELKQTPEAIEVWAVELARQFDGRPIALSLEQSRGALVAILSKYAHIHLFPLHPNKLAHYRMSVCPSGAKGDPTDADLILDYLLKHPEWLSCLEPDTVETRSLQFLVEERRKLVNEHTRQVQVLIYWLKQIFPQILGWFDEMSSPLVGDLLKRWPELPKLQKASKKTLRTFFQQHNCRSEERIQQRLEAIGQAVPATTDAALLRAGNLCIQLLVQMLTNLRAGVAEFDSQIEAIYQTHPDRLITASLPGAGPALEPRLLAALGTNRERFASASNMACCFGIAPVTESSGKTLWVHWRWACSKFVRQTFHEWANCSIRTCGWAREHYDRQRLKGKGHHASVRSVAFKWIRILFRCWRDRVPYSEQRYLQALRKRRAAPSTPAEVAAAPTTVLSTAVWENCGDFSKVAKLPS